MMNTIIIQPTMSGLEQAGRLIRSGELVAFPTETVYGLGADATNSQAVASTYVAKGRPSDNPLIVHVSSVEQIYDIASHVSVMARKVIDALMPGSITIVLPKRADVIPANVTAGLDTVAVRMPSSVVARDFVRACGVPIAAPSANTSSKPSPTCYQDVVEDMNGKISAVIAGDSCQVGIESTVLDLTTNTPVILRPGIVTASEIGSVVGVPVISLESCDNKRVNSPGVKYRHYAPSCPMVLCVDNMDKACAHYDKVVSQGYNAVILGSGDFGDRHTHPLGDSDKAVAHNLYSSIRYCDRHYGYIIAVYTSRTELSYSILNRLTKSASGNII